MRMPIAGAVSIICAVGAIIFAFLGLFSTALLLGIGSALFLFLSDL
jgi:hypothetical protein